MLSQSYNPSTALALFQGCGYNENTSLTSTELQDMLESFDLIDVDLHRDLLQKVFQNAKKNKNGTIKIRTFIQQLDNVLHPLEKTISDTDSQTKKLGIDSRAELKKQNENLQLSQSSISLQRILFQKTANHPKYHPQFIDKSVKMAIQFLERTLKAENKVINLLLPEQLKKVINFTISEEPCSEDELLSTCEKILEHQYKPYHPHNHNTLIGGFDQYAWAGSVFAASLNGCCFNYELSSCFFMMQREVFQHLRKRIGWDEIDGVLCPGGSFASFWAIHHARSRVYPDFKKKGIFGCKPMKIFVSEVSHYCWQKGAILCGLGLDNVVFVKTDQDRKIIPSQLQKAIQKEIANGNEPLIVVSTIGTTVEGSIDPMTEIGQICAKYNIWHHADGAFGGGYILHQTLIKNLGSFKNVDSVTFDPDKQLLVPMNTAIFILRHKTLMYETNNTKSECVFLTERKSYDCSLDNDGNKSLHCSRGMDIVKLWTYLKGNGWKNVAKQVQNQRNSTLYIKDYILSRPGEFELAISKVEQLCVCFWYIPQKMREKEFPNQYQFYNLLSKVTVLGHKLMLDEGKIILSYAKSKTPHYFWRMTFMNPYNSHQDLEYNLELITKYCEQAYREIERTHS